MPPGTPETKHVDPAKKGSDGKEVTGTKQSCGIYYNFYRAISTARASCAWNGYPFSTDATQCIKNAKIRVIGGKEEPIQVNELGKADTVNGKEYLYYEMICDEHFDYLNKGEGTDFDDDTRKNMCGKTIGLGLIANKNDTYNHQTYNIKSVENIYEGYKEKLPKNPVCYDSVIDLDKKIAEFTKKYEDKNTEYKSAHKLIPNYAPLSELVIYTANKENSFYGKYKAYNQQAEEYNKKLKLLLDIYNTRPSYKELLVDDKSNDTHIFISEADDIYNNKLQSIKEETSESKATFLNAINELKKELTEIEQKQYPDQINKTLKIYKENLQTSLHNHLTRYEKKITANEKYAEYSILLNLCNQLINQKKFYRKTQGGIKGVDGIATELEAEFTIHEDTTTSMLENDTCFWELYKVNKGEAQWPKSGNDKVCKLALLSAPRSPNKALLISPKDLLECSEDTENKQYISFLNHGSKIEDKNIYNRFKKNKKLKNTYFYVLGHGSPFTLGMNSTSEVFSVNESGIDNNAKYIKKHFDEITKDENGSSEFSANAWCKKDLKALEALISAKNDPVKPIVFLSCSLGAGINSFAECFSRNLTKPLTVYAANTTVVMGENTLTKGCTKTTTYTVSIAGKLKGYTQNNISYKTNKTVIPCIKDDIAYINDLDIIIDETHVANFGEKPPSKDKSLTTQIIHTKSSLTRKIAKAGIGHFRIFNYAQRVQVTNSGSGTTTDQTPNGANHP
ncbi:hypothetical protein DM558_05115 [Entomomonas moraniae]|uniref:Uncharacterized protein n=1 Tax=Entomomonas moraniae TaxID=2213226 RepID=A0A3S9XCM4_9GAMM|nr:hypothetical protein [Entomomonas moraniae]AZS50193.1 hypothetical protein DM558_05115 [Entomomonas moraniae]